jgi:hypothetical protein
MDNKCNLASLYCSNDKPLEYMLHWGSCGECRQIDHCPISTIYDHFPGQGAGYV